MRTPLRLTLALLCGSLGCIGGPVSDWPAKTHDTPRGGGTPTGTADGEGVANPSTRPVSAPNDGSSATMDAGVAPHRAADGGVDGASEACVRADAGACAADPCSEAWVQDGDDEVALGDFARLGCDPQLSDP